MATSITAAQPVKVFSDSRGAKRQKVTVSATTNGTTNRPRRSKLFAPYRTVGLVSPTAIPFTYLPLGKTTFQITTSIGRNLQTYDLKRGLHLLFITSPQTPESITATIAWERQILAAWAGESGCGVWAYQRGKKVGELQMPLGANEPVTNLIIFGSWIVGCRHSTIEVWKSATLEHYTTLYSRSGGNGFGFSGKISNLPTYLNKVFAGKEDGSVEIWNVSTGKLLYALLPADPSYGAVTALQAAPALSLLAIGYASGAIVIQDVRTDKELLAFDTDLESGPPVTSISFRTDELGAGEDGRRAGVMATASTLNGDVTFWDLNDGGRKMGILRGAHSPPSVKGDVSGGISRIEFLPGQSVLLTSGMDNALKSWIFDDLPFSPIPRILHSRGGHSASISTLQFLPPDADGAEAGGKWLLSTSKDRSFWGWSLRRDGQSTELSQGNIRKKAKKYGLLNSSLDVPGRGSMLEDLKAPRITCMACSLNRDGGIGAMPGSNNVWTNETKGNKRGDATVSATTGWESVVTGHEGDKFARTWFWGRKKAGRWKFPTGDGAEVRSVGMSPCGTFAFLGSANGGIDMFNLQSGIHRQRFPPRLTSKQAKRVQENKATAASDLELLNQTQKFARGEGKHFEAVTGIEVDSLNKTVISCGEDGKVKFWDFTSGVLVHELDWSITSISGMRYHRASDLIALACEDGAIRVIDIETKKLVRELWISKGLAVDFTFSNDGRWILVAGSDSVIRVFDLATGHLIEAMRFRSPPVALAFSNTGEYLATAHEDSVGVNLWTDRTLFSHVPTRQISNADIVDMDAPSASGEGGESILATALEQPVADEEEADQLAISTIDQLSKDLLTLSLVPKTRWQTLLHLDVIRERNKPAEPPKKPKSAPFFLPSLGDSANGQQNTTLLPTEKLESKSRISKIENPAVAATTIFTSLLRSFRTAQDPDGLVTHLSALPPSAADLAIRTLDPKPPYSELITFIEALTARLRQKRDYELVQTWMAVFLRCHSSIVTESEEVRAALKGWKEASGQQANRFDNLVGYVRGVSSWIGGVV